ncbi:hypothetical protein AMECASPLE_037640 [Ameca splendens]|uniref:Uncharacterized protein n=1 Tax=Ameca splendens TaxID=208324 RepID=A0ABV0XXB0_9TELE
MKGMNRTGDKWQPSRSPSCTGKRTNLVLAMRTKLLLHLYRDWMAPNKVPLIPYCRASPTGHHKGRGRMPSPGPQNCLGKLTGTLQYPVDGIELVHCSTAGTKTTLLFLKPRFKYQPDSPLQHPAIGLTREAEVCVPPAVGTHPLVPLLVKGTTTPVC